MNEIGMKTIQEHVLLLTTHLLHGLKSLPEVIIYGSADAELRQGIVAFNIERDGMLADEQIVAQLLNDAGIAVRAGGHCAYPLVQRLGISGAIRVSFYIYNTTEEVDYFLECLEEIIRFKLL